jgi:biotin synthase-related radical SAM superfamily protein
MRRWLILLVVLLAVGMTAWRARCTVDARHRAQARISEINAQMKVLSKENNMLMMPNEATRRREINKEGERLGREAQTLRNELRVWKSSSLFGRFRELFN